MLTPEEIRNKIFSLRRYRSMGNRCFKPNQRLRDRLNAMTDEQVKDEYLDILKQKLSNLEDRVKKCNYEIHILEDEISGYM